MTSVLDRRARPHRAQCAIAVLCGVLVLAACSGGSGGSDEARLEGITRPTPIVVENVSLPEVDPGSADVDFPFRAASGHLLFVTFGYTNCPDICPTTLADVRKARELLGADADKVDAAFVTIDPDRDRPDIIKPYITSFVATGHALRTEDAAELTRAKDAFGVRSSVTTEADGTVNVTHTARSFVVDDQGQIAVEWPFGLNSDAMAHDLRILLDR